MQNHPAAKTAFRQRVSPLRKTYMARLVARCLILMGSILLRIFRPEAFDIVEKGAFLERFSVLHLLWLVWMADMAAQLLPMRCGLALGSQKYMAFRFRPAERETDRKKLKAHLAAVGKRAAGVFVLWTALTAAIGVLFYRGVLGRADLVLVSVFFYVCDLICVLIWCPFRLMLGNRCCTTCRIFNWDHLMMFSPLVFMSGFFALSLVVPAVAVFVLWEISVIRHPERFWEQTNTALRCSVCTDKLCTQYCQKRRR